MNYFEEALPRYGEYTEAFSDKKVRCIIHQFVALDGKTYAVIERETATYLKYQLDI